MDHAAAIHSVVQVGTACYYTPSKEIEQRTHALEPMAWGLALSAIFLANFIIIPLDLLFLNGMGLYAEAFSRFSLLQFLSLVFLLTFPLLVVSFIVSAQMICYRISYKFEDGRITRGLMQKIPNPTLNDVLLSGEVTSYIFRNLSNYQKVQAADTVLQMHRFFKMKALNASAEFAAEYFDTDVYRRKIYEHPVFKCETRRFLIFQCEGGRQLKIRKMYDMPYIRNAGAKRNSLAERIAKKIVIGLILMMCFSALYIACGAAYVKTHDSDRESSRQYVEDLLSSYGYTVTGNKASREEEYNGTDRTSSIRYKISAAGEIYLCEMNLYYSEANADVGEELTAILELFGQELSDEEAESFTEDVLTAVSGEYIYKRVEDSSGMTFTIGLSGGFVHVSAHES